MTTLLKEAIIRVLYPFVMAVAFLRFKDIWGVKSRLERRSSHLLELCYGKYFVRRGCFVGLTSSFGGKPCLPHGLHGIFVSNEAVIGKDAVIFQHVTIGSNTLRGSKRQGSPVIGDNVYIGAGAKIIGGIKIGDNCRIGANAVVYADMPSNSVAVCAPTRVITRGTALDNTYRTFLGGKWYGFSDGGLHEEGE